MPQPRAVKEQVVQSLETRLAEAQSVYLTDFSGLNVEAITELRRVLRAQSVECRVVKNTLSRFAVHQAGLPNLDAYLEGPTALIISKDPVASAKTLIDFTKTHENRPRIKGGVLTGAVIDATQVQALASLPSREELIAKVVGGIAAPITGLVFSLSGMLGNLVRVLSAAAAQKESGGTSG
jgi:large subunit ribosomal protein L10